MSDPYCLMQSSVGNTRAVREVAVHWTVHLDDGTEGSPGTIVAYTKRLVPSLFSPSRKQPPLTHQLAGGGARLQRPETAPAPPNLCALAWPPYWEARGSLSLHISR